MTQQQGSWEQGNVAPAALYSARELWADGVIHALGVGGALIGFIAMIIVAAPATDVWSLTSLVVYGLGAILVFTLSAVYNLDLAPSRREVMRRLDHAAIFLKIAGTYTPFAIIALDSITAAGLLGVVWLIAAIGVPMKLLAPAKMERVAIWLYLLQGWMVALAFGPLASAISGNALALIIVGGALYTVGVVFFIWRTLPYQNAIWHAFVLIASACMYFAVIEVATLEAHAAAPQTPPSDAATMVL